MVYPAPVRGWHPVTWAPPARPVWVERLIAYGDAVGGPEHLVGLDPDELVATAVASTGLDDFGPPTWRPHYDVLLKALEQESDLHLVGRLMARAALRREETRGSHARADFPSRDDVKFRIHLGENIS